MRKSTRTKYPNSNGRVAATLRDELSPDDLTGPEQEFRIREINKKMALPSRREFEFFNEGRRLGNGVGLDENGEIVHEKPEK